MAIIRSLAVLMAVVLGVAASGRAQTASDSKWKAVEDAMGRPGQMQPGDVARRSIYDWPTLLLALITLAVLFKWKVPEALVIALAAVAGLILRGRVL